MKKIILSALTVVALISNSHAQLMISPVGGLNVSGYTAATGDKRNFLFGPCAGVFVDFPSQSKLSLQSGLLYKLNGFRTPIYGGFIGIRISTIEVPVKVTYSFSMKKGSKFFIGAGPYVAVNVAASERFHGYTTDIAGNPVNLVDDVRPIDVDKRNGIRRIDGGMGINFGYRAAKGLLICLQGQYGLVNQGNDFVKIHNYNFGVVAGYSFKLKKHKEESLK